jgi:hypothetical protein
MKKPLECRACPLASVGTGFCGDHFPAAPKAAYLFSFPYKDEVIENRCLAGGMGGFLKRFLLDDHGRTEDEVICAHVLRCQPPAAKGRIEYPSGYLKRASEAACRAYDDRHAEGSAVTTPGIWSWRPDLFIVTLDPGMATEVEAYKYLIREDVKKAWRFVERGRRPCVLFGREALQLVGDFLEGGVKDWRGHYWEVDGWPFSGVPSVTRRPFEE